jgi:amino acid transporter/mannitol/fructose-specific phosphotransferase system IIA component (Ntr-type)
MAILESNQRLKKELGLFDVFAVSTGAMFSSGFFLLPGLAAAKAGPSVVLAYILAGILILPAMFSAAELSTALPRAGGAYYFLDRSLGPMVGTIGGLGTYLALSLKTAFALLGIGAYLRFYVDIPMQPLAVGLTILFMIINIFGAKETTTLQRWLVSILVGVLALFILHGFAFLLSGPGQEATQGRFDNFMPNSVEGLLATVGFVFVSYAGLTKVASVAEEVKNPDRNIPLGMMLSLGVTSFIYAAGVYIMVAVLDTNVLAGDPATGQPADLTPVATAGDAFFSWIPKEWALFLIVAAALAAFASTGNAGLMASSRYPFAMARDRLVPPLFGRLGKFNTPVNSILATGVLMILFIVALDAEKIAKLASAFQLFIFMLVNLAVIVMRESHIPSYDPGYRSPWYPWMQIFGIVTSGMLIIYMGAMAILFTIAIVVGCLLWYFKYAADHVVRDGAIYHWFARLGTRQYDALDAEFRSIMKEKGLREQDPFEELVARSLAIDLTKEATFEEIINKVSAKLARRLPQTAEQIYERFMHGTATGETPVTQGVCLPHFRLREIEHGEMVLVRSKFAINVPTEDPDAPPDPEQDVKTMFCLVSPEENPAQHLRILAQLAGRVDDDTFVPEWEAARNEQELREVLLRDEHFMTVCIIKGTPAAELEGKAMKELRMPVGTLVAMINRHFDIVVPRGDTVLEENDRLTIIGEPAGLAEVRRRYPHTSDSAYS